MAGGAAIFGANEEFSCNGTSGDAVFLFKEFSNHGKPKPTFYQQIILWALKITNDMVSVNVLFGVRC